METSIYPAVPAAAILKHDKTLETSLHGQQWPLPASQPSPDPPLFSGIVYLLSFVMASRKIHFKEEKNFG